MLWPSTFGFHELWHLLVVVASCCTYSANNSVLKRGGQFVFLEHVLASPDADPWRRSVQDAIEPGEQEGVVLLFLLLLLLCFDDECLSLFLLGFFFLFLA